MKNQKGMSYITLIVIIIILAFVIAITIHFSKIMIENKKFESYETDMLQIQGKVKILQQEAIMDDDDEKFVGRKLENFSEIEEVKQLIESNVIVAEGEDYSKYYIIDNLDLEKIGLENIKVGNGFYVVNYNTEEVIYSEGIEKEDNIYYKLSDMKNIGKEDKADEESDVAEEVEEETIENEEEATEEETSEE